MATHQQVVKAIRPTLIDNKLILMLSVMFELGCNFNFITMMNQIDIFFPIQQTIAMPGWNHLLGKRVSQSADGSAKVGFKAAKQGAYF